MIYTKFRKNLIFFFFENLKNHEEIYFSFLKIFRIFSQKFKKTSEDPIVHIKKKN